MNKMKRIIYGIMACLAVGLVWSCSGTIDPEGDELELTLTADHLEIIADGESEAIFKVMLGTQDVSTAALITCTSGSATVKNHRFSTIQEGTYTFTASYDGRISDELEIKAVAPVESRFMRHVCVMEFTGTWCAQCPSGAVALNYLVDEAYKGKAFAMAFHNDDIYAIPQEKELYNKFKVDGYPGFVTDMRDAGSLNGGGCSTSIEKSLYETQTHSGAALKCTSSANDDIVKVSVTAKVFSEKEMSYSLAAYVIEDKIKGEQNLGNQTDTDYTHRHVVRKMLSATIMGDALGIIQREEEVEKKYEFTLDPTWNPDNLSIAVLVIDEAGHVNNMAICSCPDGEMGYEMKK